VLDLVMQPISYARHRFPPDIIRHAVWLYLRFTLSYRDVEDLLAERGLMVSNESIRRWVLKFGPIIAKNLHAIRPKAHSRWHLDEKRRRGSRNPGPAPTRQGPALRLLRKLFRRQGFVPTVIVTDQLRSYGAALRENWLLWIARARTARQQSSGEFSSAASTTRCRARDSLLRRQLNARGESVCEGTL
jgi:transposase-like protein